jgi:hypothetical protein
MAKVNRILVEKYTILNATQIQLDNHSSAQTIHVAYVYNKTQDILYYAPAKGYGNGTTLNGVITLPNAAIVTDDIIHIQIWENVGYDETFDSQKILQQNPDSEVRVYNSLVDGAVSFDHSNASDATFNVTVTRGVVTSVAVVSGGAGYALQGTAIAAKTTGEFYIALDFNSGRGCVIRCNCDASGVLSVYSSATACIVTGGTGYTDSGTPITGLLYDEFPSFAGITMDGANDISISGFLQHGITAGGTAKLELEWTNDEDTSTATSAKWNIFTFTDTTDGTKKNVIETIADIDKAFGIMCDSFKVASYRVTLKYLKTLGTTVNIKAYTKF